MTLLLALLLDVAVLTMRISPQACFAPCDLTIRTRVERHPANRWLVVVADGGMYREAWQPLEGDRAAITQPEIIFRALPAGDYRVVAVLYRATGSAEAGRVTLSMRVGGG